MRDHELELIAALVEGRLKDEAEARALIASSTELTEEYESQKLAFETLSAIGPASLTDVERAGLHRDVWADLRSAGSSAKTPTPWYMRWTTVAAGLFVVVGLLAVLNQGGADTFEEASAPLSADESVTTTAAASTEGDSGGVTPEQSTDGADTTIASAGDARALSASETAYYSAEAERVRNDSLTGAEELTPEEASNLQSCVASAGYPGYTVVGTVQPGEPGGSETADSTGSSTSTTDFTDEDTAETIPPPANSAPFIAAIPEGAELESAVVAFIDLTDCELIHIDE